MNDNVCCFAGQSGVGKSTLLNFFDHTLNLKTQEISEALGRGKHTTRHTELLSVGTGWVADTPGFGNVDFPFDDLLSLSHSFVEFFEKSDDCKFRGCLHLEEPGCAVRELADAGRSSGRAIKITESFRTNLRKNKERNIRRKYDCSAFDTGS